MSACCPACGFWSNGGAPVHASTCPRRVPSLVSGTPAAVHARCSRCGLIPTYVHGHGNLCGCPSSVSRTAPTEPPPADGPADWTYLPLPASMRPTPYGAMPSAPRLAAVACSHVFAHANDADAIVCRECGVRVSGLQLAALRIMGLRDAHDAKRNALADECGRLRDQVRDLEAENGRLRRDVERLTRKGGGR